MTQPIYNGDNPINVISTLLFVLGSELVKEGYKLEDIERIIMTVGLTTNAIINKQLQITERGIEPVQVQTNENVVQLKKD